MAPKGPFLCLASPNKPLTLSSARRVFLIADNGSSHRGRPASDRLRAKWPNIVLVHTPVHASWLNQIEVYFLSSSANSSLQATLPTGRP